MASSCNLPNGEKTTCTTVITSLSDLKPGNHICLPWDWGDYYRRRHMIVEEVDEPRILKAKVIHYHSNSKSGDERIASHTVIETWEPIDPTEYKVWRYEYTQVATFPKDRVLANARQCLGKTGDELKGIIPPPSRRVFLSASRYFAEWCLTGKGWDFVNPAPPGDIPEHCGAKELGMTCISSVDELQIADHVALVDRYGGLTHGLVDSIYHKKGHIHVFTYNVKDDTKPRYVQLVTWYFGTRKGDIEVYRYNYGMNQCVSPGHALQRANRYIYQDDSKLGKIIPDITECPDWSLMSLYFVRWCKMGKGWGYEPVGETQLENMSQLKPGDHLQIKRYKGVYSHHIIVESITQRGLLCEVEIIHNTKHGEVECGKCSVKEIERKSLGKDQEYLDFASGNVFRVNYHPNDILDTDDVIARARSLVGRQNYQLLSFNCEHFARWCKTGEELSLQVVEVWETVSRGFALVSNRFVRVVAAEAFTEMLETTIWSLDSMGLSAIELGAVLFVLKKESDSFKTQKGNLEKLLARQDISQEVYDQKLRNYTIQAVTRLGGMIMGIIIGEIVETRIPVPILRNLVTVSIVGAGYLLGNGLGFLLNRLADQIVVMLPKIKAKIKDIFVKTCEDLAKLLIEFASVFEQLATSARALNV